VLLVRLCLGVCAGVCDRDGDSTGGLLEMN
jgi:hypothetical protein